MSGSHRKDELNGERTQRTVRYLELDHGLTAHGTRTTLAAVYTYAHILTLTRAEEQIYTLSVSSPSAHSPTCTLPFS